MNSSNVIKSDSLKINWLLLILGYNKKFKSNFFVLYL